MSILSRDYMPAYEVVLETNDQRVRNAVITRLSLDARLAKLERLDRQVRELSALRRFWWRVSGRLPRG